MKNKSLVEKVRMLQKTVSVEQAARKVLEEETVHLKGLVSASNELTAKLAESDKSLEAASEEVASLKEQVKLAYIKKMESEIVVAEVHEE